MDGIIYYAPALTALISFCSLIASASAWYSIRQRATRQEMLAMERRLVTLEMAREAAPGWTTFDAMRQELRDLHGHIEKLSGEMKGISHNTGLILEQLLADRRERRDENNRR
jgi:hypothetical protein